MFKRIKSILFVICAVMVFTAQANRPDDKEKQHAPAGKPAHTARPAPAARPVPAARPAVSRPQVQTRREAPAQFVKKENPGVQVHLNQPSDQGRPGPRVYAVPSSTPTQNNRLLGRQHHNHWQPLYNFYNNQYQFYPYVNVTSPVELSADCVAVSFNGQTYYYDQGSFYVQDPQGYLAVPPPVGIVVSVIPQRARQIDAGGQIYYRYKGVFCVQVAGGYQVVGPVQADTDNS